MIEMKTQQAEERECVIEMALTANTMPEIIAAERRLREYIIAHPEDRNIADAGEPLALRRMGLEEDEALSKQAA